jgi:hypothetical protein
VTESNQARVTAETSLEAQPEVGADRSEDISQLKKLDPTFKLVFLSVLGLTVLSLVLHVVLVVTLKQPNDQAKLLIETCSTLTKTGFGAMVGLVGGKVL